MSQVFYSTRPAPNGPQPPQRKASLRWLWPASIIGATALLVLAPGGPGALGGATLGIFALAVWAWVGTRLSDTYVALCACLLLLAVGSLQTTELFLSLADPTIWLLIGAFLVAAGVSASGLANYVGLRMVARARSVRQLFYLLTLALCVTAFAIPATSGRAALALPIFTVLAGIFAAQRCIVVGLSLLIPSVVLLSAVASLIGAGAHLVTNQLLTTAGYAPIDFMSWLILGTPLALLSSIAACELILRLQVPSAQRGRLEPEVRTQLLQRATGGMSPAMYRAGGVLVTVVLAWAAGPLIGMDPAIAALGGAALMNFPGLTGAKLSTSVKNTPLNILMFLAFTLALGTALSNTGAANWLTSLLFAPIKLLGTGASVMTLALIAALSLAAHLLIQSRSARSAVLIPLVIPLAIEQGVNPVAAAFLSTAAAGFCHTLTSSAKPVALFSDLPDTPTFTPADLRRFAIWFAPLMFVLLMIFLWIVWPALGLHPLMTHQN
ncbi:SLC13 family permease [Glutamicibacter sp. X7]